jgi:hypothetical protein
VRGADYTSSCQHGGAEYAWSIRGASDSAVIDFGSIVRGADYTSSCQHGGAEYAWSTRGASDSAVIDFGSIVRGADYASSSRHGGADYTSIFVYVFGFDRMVISSHVPTEVNARNQPVLQNCFNNLSSW